MRLAFLASPYYRQVAESVSFDESAAIRSAFAARGATLEVIDADDLSADWRRFDAVLPLGFWGYHKDPAGFRAFITKLEALSVRMINAPELLVWNLDKSYLVDMQRAGVDVAPLLHFPAGSQPDLVAALRDTGWSRYVIKPTISANALQTIAAQGTPSAEVLQLSRDILSRCGLLIQPFFEEIPRDGEWSLLFNGTTLSHAVIKVPKPGDFRSQPDHGAQVTPVSPPPHIVAQAAAALSASPRPPVYARVDGFVRDDRLQLIELELIEPSLFFKWADADAPGRFCDAVLAACRAA